MGEIYPFNFSLLFAEKFTEVAKSENSAKISYNNLQIQMLGKLKTMVDVLVENPKTMSVANKKAMMT